MRLALLILVVVLLNGCVPLPLGGYTAFCPHTTTRLNSFDGRVLDEGTHAPVSGAKVFLTEHPKVACKTDSSGHFKFKEMVNWHWGYTGNPAGGDDLPSGEQWGQDITVLHTNYMPYATSYDWFGKGDIFLKPKP